LQIQIRYADTQEQKSLKQQTQAARQFRSAEYEYATQAWRQGRLPHAGTAVHDSTNGNEFEQYLGTSANVPFQGQRWAQSALRCMPGRNQHSGLPTQGAGQQPLVQINVASGTDNAADAKGTGTSPVTVHTSPVDSANSASEQD
ncbi:hypothetical protein KC315_g19377, partial [Hortaea werneckii]